jgi:hypothetical protein
MNRALGLVMVVMSVAAVGQQKPRAKAAVAAPVQDSAWVAEQKQRQDELIAKNGPGTDVPLQARLLSMRDTDQQARGISHGASKSKGAMQIAVNLKDVDANLTAQLKEIVAKSGWPTIGLVGLEASNGAMTILTHTTDHAWQLSLLPQLESLADLAKIDGAPLAMVIDKELVSEGKLQRYGTQFKYVDGGMAMLGVEDPGGLDGERAKVGLPPMGVYKAQLEAIYHLKVTGKVVMASAPVAKE